MSELKSCPFCGGEVKHVKMPWDDYCFCCHDCGLQAKFVIAPTQDEGELKEERRLWNTRENERTCHLGEPSDQQKGRYHCSECGWSIGRYDSYCHTCGAKVVH